MNPSPRPDLVDDGVFRRPAGPGARVDRDSPTLLTGEDLTAPVDELGCVGYDLHGRETASEGEMVAKVVTPAGRPRHFARFSTREGTLFNPRGLYDTALGSLDARGRRELYAFRPVPAAAFEDYLHFLRSGDANFLRRAERTALNA